MSAERAFPPRACRTTIAFALSLIVSGCMQPTPPVDTPPPQQKRAARPGISPSGATVSIVGFDSGSEDVARRFSAFFVNEANARDVASAPAEAAHYLLRGYLTAASTGDGGVRPCLRLRPLRSPEAACATSVGRDACAWRAGRTHGRRQTISRFQRWRRAAHRTLPIRSRICRKRLRRRHVRRCTLTTPGNNLSVTHRVVTLSYWPCVARLI